MLVGVRTGAEPAVEAGAPTGATVGLGTEVDEANGVAGFAIVDSGKRGVAWGIVTAPAGAMDSPE